MALLGVYSDPQRDRRGHTASVVYIAQAQGLPHAQDDAVAAGLFSPQRLPENLAFDHRLILADYFSVPTDWPLAFAEDSANKRTSCCG